MRSACVSACSVVHVRVCSVRGACVRVCSVRDACVTVRFKSFTAVYLQTTDLSQRPLHDCFLSTPLDSLQPCIEEKMLFCRQVGIL